MGLLPRTTEIRPMDLCVNNQKQFSPNSANLRGVFAGSGNAGMSNEYLASAVLNLTRRPPQEVTLLYIGTATYDIVKYRDIQTKAFAKLGCRIKSLDVANESPATFEEMVEALDKAHVILVSGGNTLYAVDRWKSLGLDELLKEAAYRGTVIAGGSAGAICWFDGGHSDSMDPETYRLAMLEQDKLSRGGFVGPTVARSVHFEDTRDGSGNPQEAKAAKGWDYIRVEGLGIFPGIVCPHYDRVQSNGVPRFVDFDSMMERHSSEFGIGIDHNAALEIDGENFRILSIPGEKGSVPSSVEGQSNSALTSAGVWIKNVDGNGNVCSEVCPSSGKVRDLLKFVEDRSKHRILDERASICRKENPGPSLTCF